MELKVTPKILENGRVWNTFWGSATSENGVRVLQEDLGNSIYAIDISCVSVIWYKNGDLSVEISSPLLTPVGEVKYLTVGKSTVERSRFIQLFGREVYETLLTLEVSKRHSLEGRGRIAWKWAPRKEEGELYFSELDTDCPNIRIRLFAGVGGLLPNSAVRAWEPAPAAPKAPAPLAPLPTLVPLTPQPPKLGVPEAPAPAALDNV